jgi:hypothetical protein
MKTDLTRRDVLAMLAALGMTATEAELVFAQSPDPAAGKVVFENEKVRVISHLARPRAGVCGTDLHSHPPHLTVVLTDVKAKVTLPGKDPFIDEQKAGAVFWDPGGPHVVENLGSRDTKVYLIELKA